MFSSAPTSQLLYQPFLSLSSEKLESFLAVRKLSISLLLSVSYTLGSPPLFLLGISGKLIFLNAILIFSHPLYQISCGSFLLKGLRVKTFASCWGGYVTQMSHSSPSNLRHAWHEEFWWSLMSVDSLHSFISISAMLSLLYWTCLYSPWSVSDICVKLGTAHILPQ